MQERFNRLIWTGAVVLAACGGVEDGGVLARSSAALSCQTDTDCGEGYACAHFSQRNYCEASAPATTTSAVLPSCHSDADCKSGEECEWEHGASYCAPHDADEPHAQADAGAPPQEYAEEHCRHHGEDCTRSCASGADAGADDRCAAEHDADAEYPSEVEHDGDDEDRSGSNRGRH